MSRIALSCPGTTFAQLRLKCEPRNRAVNFISSTATGGIYSATGEFPLIPLGSQLAPKVGAARNHRFFRLIRRTRACTGKTEGWRKIGEGEGKGGGRRTLLRRLQDDSLARSGLDSLLFFLPRPPPLRRSFDLVPLSASPLPRPFPLRKFLRLGVVIHARGMMDAPDAQRGVATPASSTSNAPNRYVRPRGTRLD